MKCKPVEIKYCTYLDEDYKKAVTQAIREYENKYYFIPAEAVIFRDLPEFKAGGYDLEKNVIYFNANLTIDKFYKWAEDNNKRNVKTISQLVLHEIGHSLGIRDENEADLFALSFGGMNV